MNSNETDAVQGNSAQSGLAAAPEPDSATTDSATPSTSGSETAGSLPQRNWIDAHVHVWTPDIKRYPLGWRFDESAMVPPSFTPEELFQHCRPVGVQRVVLVQMSFYEYDHTYMLEAMKVHPGVFSGVALIDHKADDLVERVEKLAGQGMRGVRLYSPKDADDWAGDPRMATLWKKASESGLAICPLINPAEIPYVAAMCEKFPETTVVIDHFARIGVSGRISPRDLDQLCRLARFAKTHVKTSAFYALGKKKPPYKDLIPMIQRVIDCFGPERLMWASDCPYQVQDNHTYEASIALIRDEIDGLSEPDKDWMLRGTAEKLFFTPQPK